MLVVERPRFNDIELNLDDLFIHIFLLRTGRAAHVMMGPHRMDRAAFICSFGCRGSNFGVPSGVGHPSKPKKSSFCIQNYA